MGGVQIKSIQLNVENFSTLTVLFRLTWPTVNHSCSAYTAINGGVCLSNLQEPFVSVLRVQRES